MGKNNDYQALSKEFFSKVQGDPKLQELLQNYAQERIQHHPETFHSHAFGEGNYSSEQIKEAHKNVTIDDHHFESMVDHFVQALNVHGYSDEDKKKALEMLKGYKDMVLSEQL
ncbi:hypothetical protein H1D32_02415 [Anaerobacillus sp. CMMVII]|uniref:globin domain-containing protein n=1 Tax=Anaerobacillus sp. CMMVII TaxID=2755588 RepID=UPI0021B80C93|nr:hypothetical protein [Anaerobacillus sp. CMMVII]MCT8136703.1 hypothetical protein [Anaerobacillus sp. CMMVII]